ncbi:hypothetical protein EDB19DRAFT_1840340, partial [Suillus lakei]
MTENTNPSILSKCSSSALQIGPRKKATVFALCNYPSLLTNGILRLKQMEDTPLEEFSAEFLSQPSGMIENWIGKGAAGARGDDMKTLKSVVLDWIAPKGEAIRPPLHRNSKIDHRFNHELTGSLLCPAGLDWNDPWTTFEAAS